MKTAQHERIEIVSDDSVQIARNSFDGLTKLWISDDEKTLYIEDHKTIRKQAWDGEGLEALTLCINSFRQTGSFKALRDGEVALFVGGKVRDLTGNTQSILLIQKERCWLTTLEWTHKADLLPLISPPPPKVRPYTPREAVEFLGRKATDGVLQFAVTSIEKHRIGVLTPNVCNKLSYEEFAEHYTWADTGEPCGVVETVNT